MLKFAQLRPPPNETPGEGVLNRVAPKAEKASEADTEKPGRYCHETV